MKTRFLLAALVLSAAPLWAQPDPTIEPPNGLPFPLISPAQAEKLALVKPIKMRLDNVTVAWALEVLQQQSGIELDMENINYSKNTLAKKLSIDIETPSFNRAFDEIMDEAGLKANLQRYDSNRPYRVNFNGRYNNEEGEGAPVSSAGLFGVKLSRLNTTLSKTVDLRIFGSPQRSERNNLSAYILVQPDPRLPVVGAPRPRLTRAEDEQGRSLLVPEDKDNKRNNRRNDVYSFYSTGQQQATLTLLPPAPDAKKFSHLEGVVVYTLVTKKETWEVPDLLSAPQWTRQFKSGDQTYDMTVKATPAKGKPENRVALTVEISSNQRFKSDEIPPPMLAASPVMAALRIRDAKGNELRNNSGYGSARAGTDGKLTVNATFYPSNAYYQNNEDTKTLALPLKMTFEAPLEAAQTEAPFSFENVPLP